LDTVTTFEVQRGGDRLAYESDWLQSRRSFSCDAQGGVNRFVWGSLTVFNEDLVAPGRGFDSHGHQDMEILTYVLQGHLRHRDSSGRHGIIGPGSVQFMSAGTGIRHSEYNESDREPLRFLQMWIAPGELGARPRYAQRDVRKDDSRNRWLAVASGRAAIQAPIHLTQDAAFLISAIETEHHLRHTFDPDRLGFAFVTNGEIRTEATVGGDRTVGQSSLSVGDAVMLSDVERITFTGSGSVVLWDLSRLTA
jgi:quercetin 2,3-dioxygenase